MNIINNFIRNLIQKQCQSWAEARFIFFIDTMKPKKGSTILDLGGAGGNFFYHFKKMVEQLKLKINVGDIDERALAVASSRGFDIILLKENDISTIAASSFDIVFCNSVIEHVTIPKNEIWTCESDDYFKQASFKHQKDFASDIKRIGRGTLYKLRTAIL